MTTIVHIKGIDLAKLKKGASFYAPFPLTRSILTGGRLLDRGEKFPPTPVQGRQPLRSTPYRFVEVDRLGVAALRFTPRNPGRKPGPVVVEIAYFGEHLPQFIDVDGTLTAPGAIEADEECQRRRIEIERAPWTGKEKNAAYFFLELECSTHPVLLFNRLKGLVTSAPESALIDSLRVSIEMILNTLFTLEASMLKRVGLRRERASRSLDAIEYPEAERRVDLLTRVSELMSKLIRKHFRVPRDSVPDPAGLERILHGFNLFASGKIRRDGVQMNGEPDSSHFFLFAQFAALAVESGVDPEFWNALLPVFVAAQKTYVAAYPPKDRPVNPLPWSSSPSVVLPPSKEVYEYFPANRTVGTTEAAWDGRESYRSTTLVEKRRQEVLREAFSDQGEIQLVVNECQCIARPDPKILLRQCRLSSGLGPDLSWYCEILEYPNADQLSWGNWRSQSRAR